MRIAVFSLFSLVLLSALGQTLLAGLPARPGLATRRPNGHAGSRPGRQPVRRRSLRPVEQGAGRQEPVLLAHQHLDRLGDDGRRGPGADRGRNGQGIHLAGILPQAHAEYHKALDRWNSADKDRGYTLRVANRLWGQKGFPFLAGYLTLTRQQYGAEMGLVDFAGRTEAARQEINAWVEKQTADKIKDLLRPGVLDGRPGWC